MTDDAEKTVTFLVCEESKSENLSRLLFLSARSVAVLVSTTDIL